MAQKIQKEAPSLESAMQRISEIVTSMEEGNLPLENLIDSYEEGIGLVKADSDHHTQCARRYGSQ